MAQFNLNKIERQRELQRNIKTGHLIRKIYNEQGKYNNLMLMLEPHLTRKDRELFGLNF